MVSQSNNGFPLYGFSIIIWFPLYGFSNFVAPGVTKSHTTLGEIVRLYNCAVVDEGFG